MYFEDCPELMEKIKNKSNTNPSKIIFFTING